MQDISLFYNAFPKSSRNTDFLNYLIGKIKIYDFNINFVET